MKTVKQKLTPEERRERLLKIWQYDEEQETNRKEAEKAELLEIKKEMGIQRIIDALERINKNEQRF